MHFLGLAGMPRRIPDFPDMYWSWNYISSVGSLVSVFGVLVFFWLIADLYLVNSLFFQVRNNYYVIILNSWFIRKTSYFSFTKNTYVFSKYNFFTIYNKGYLFLDRFVLSMFVETTNKINSFIDTTDTTSLQTMKSIFSSHSSLPEVFKFASYNLFLNTVVFIIQGWVSIFMAFFVSKNNGLNFMKLYFYYLITINFLKNMPSTYSLILTRILRENKITFFKF